MRYYRIRTTSTPAGSAAVSIDGCPIEPYNVYTMHYGGDQMAELPNWKKNKVARNRAYNDENYAKIYMAVSPATKEHLQAMAAAKGMSLTAYLLDCAEKVEAMG